MGFPGMMAPSSAQAAESEKRQRERQAFQQFLMSTKYAAESTQWWRPVDRDMDQNDLTFEDADPGAAVLRDVPNVKGMMKDGLYQKDGVDFNILVKNGTFTTVPRPKDITEFKQHFSELMKAVALGKGCKQVTIDYPANANGTNSNINFEEVMSLLEIAREQGLSVKLGPTLQAVLTDPYRHLPDSPHNKWIKNWDKAKLAEKFVQGRDKIYGIVKELELAQQGNPRLYETEKAVEFSHQEREIGLKQRALKEAATALAAAIDNNNPTEMKKALADLKNAEQGIEKALKEVKEEISTLNEDGQHEISKRFEAQYRAILDNVTAASIEAKDIIYPAAPGAGAPPRAATINGLADPGLKAELQPATGIEATVFKPLTDMVQANREEADKKLAAINSKHP